MNTKQVRGVGSLLWILAIGILSFRQLSTPEPVNVAGRYSAYRAQNHLKQIASKPHPGGSGAHSQVRNYIVKEAGKYVDSVAVINQTGLREYRSLAVAGNAYNILARMSGRNSSKAILLAGHYDTQPNSPGAADDGSAVASMLEVMQLLSGYEHEHDVYFLFTDLEEVGLLGAEAFVHDYDSAASIALIINFEARGNSGINFTFETSEGNGWLIDQYAKAVSQPRANSLGYEIYKLMPNDTDFSEFKKTGVAGLNTAFLGGFAYYHSPEDHWENIDLGSLQNQGDLMWQLTSHLSNTDLTATRSNDVIYFNIFNWVISYPPFWDWVAMLACAVLFIILITTRHYTIAGTAKGMAWYVVFITLSLAITWLFTAVVLAVNPHFGNFYSYNFYDSPVYLWMYAGGVGIAALVSLRLFRKPLSLLPGPFIIHLTVAVIIKLFLPTGAFIIYLPLFWALVILVFLPLFPGKQWVLGYKLPLPALLLWIPFIYFLFVVFSLSLPYASVLFMILLVPHLLPAIDQWLAVSTRLPWIMAAGMVLIGFSWAQLKSVYDTGHPLQVQLAYAADIDSEQAHWIAPQRYIDDFTRLYTSDDSWQTLPAFFPGSTSQFRVNDAPYSALNHATFEILHDSTTSAARTVRLHIVPGHEVVSHRMSLTGGGTFSRVIDRQLERPVGDLRLYAPDKKGYTLDIEVAAGEKINLHLVESKLGISRKLLTYTMPDNYIFGTGNLSNMMLLKQTFTF